MVSEKVGPLGRLLRIIRASSLAFRQRHRFVWCCFCGARMPRSLCGSLTRVFIPSRPRAEYLTWTCLQCWHDMGRRAAS